MKTTKDLFRPMSLATALLLSSVTVAGAAETATERLSPETRKVLVEEMQMIASAMGPLHTAVVTGEHEAVAEQARRIRDSFVLKQKLTAAQRQEIGTRLPKAFINGDRQFHQLAGRLGEAGDRQDSALERFYFEEMTRACQSCHQDFAGGRFPGLAGGSEPEMHGH